VATIPKLVPERLRWPAAGVAIAGWLVLVGLGLRYSGEHIAGPLDRSLTGAVRTFATDRNWVAHLLVVSSHEVLIYTVVGLVVVDGLSRRRWEHAAFAALVPAVAIVLTEAAFKPLFHRVHLGALAYPSGHTVSSVSAYAVAVLALTAGLRRRDRLIGAAVWLALTVMVGVGLVGMDYHYPTDWIGGVALVLGLALPAALLADALTARRTARIPVPAPD
jgi:membrane-associated phospholipid phosphatase